MIPSMQVLVIHIKRFRYSSARREKLSTDVLFPLQGLDLESYVSPDLPPLAPGAGGTDIDRSSLSSSSGSGDVLKSNNDSAKEGADESGVGGIATEDSVGVGAVGVGAVGDVPPEYAGLLRKVAPQYDLVGVCNHHGSLNSGHYSAHADTSGLGAHSHGAGGGGDRHWCCFNDSRVSPANPSAVSGPTAYVLFYRLLERQS
jgi:hypothetical protein